MLILLKNKLYVSRPQLPPSTTIRTTMPSSGLRRSVPAGLHDRRENR